MVCIMYKYDALKKLIFSSLCILGDKAFAEFLSDEIKEEKKIQKNKNLPKMSGGWELELNGTEAKLVRFVSGDKYDFSWLF